MMDERINGKEKDTRLDVWMQIEPFESVNEASTSVLKQVDCNSPDKGPERREREKKRVNCENERRVLAKKERESKCVPNHRNELIKRKKKKKKKVHRL